MAIHWHRRDLRGTDNWSLSAAATTGPVYPLFVLDPVVLDHASAIRVACLCDALSSLREWYRERGSDLAILRGDASAVVPAVATTLEADTVHWNDDYTGLAAERDRAVTAALEDDGRSVSTVTDAICHEPGSISPQSGEHYQVFTYFWKKWRDRDKRSPVDAPGADELATGPATEWDLAGYRVVGEPTPDDLGFSAPSVDPEAVTPTQARSRLATFCADPIYEYDEQRDYPAADATARLSVHLKWGTVGIREVYEATEDAYEAATADSDRESVRAFQRQLAWREFYAHAIAYTPSLVSENVVEYTVDWRNDPAELDAWKAGETGYPIVDAGMRQLRREGWVHNRVRMLVASFLTKDLRVDWREGYAWYREHLADHDTANDVGGWQWAASTGFDAQPYFRVFNPTTQGQRYDPDAEYIRAYVPELAEATPDQIHGWEDLSTADRREVAPNYPDPIVDHADRREAAIEAFERARGN